MRVLRHRPKQSHKRLLSITTIFAAKAVLVGLFSSNANADQCTVKK